MRSFRLLLYPLLLTGINVYFYLSKWSILPEKLVRQVTADGLPAAYWNKTAAMVFITLLCLGLTLMLAAMLRAFRATLAGTVFPRLKIGTLVIAVYAVIAFITSMNFWVLRYHLAKMPSFAIPLYYHLPLIGISMLLGAMQVALAGEFFTVSAAELAAARDRVEPENPWRLGIIYYNPNDKRLWVTKRTGLGWTLNFGQGMSYVIMAALILIPMLIIVLIRAAK